MFSEEAIAREVLFPYLQKDDAYKPVSGDLWRVFLKGLLGYEHDPKPLYAALYGLQLRDPEKLIRLLPRIHDEFLEQLAEQYVRGHYTGMVENSGLLKNSRFREHLEFFSHLQTAMTRLERRRMIRELPAAYAAISEELSDQALSAGIRKVNREQLREKFKRWEKEEERSKEAGKNIIFTNSLQMEYSASAYIPEGKQLLVPPPEEKPKSSLKKVWLLVVLLVVAMAFAVWLL